MQSAVCASPSQSRHLEMQLKAKEQFIKGKSSIKLPCDECDKLRTLYVVRNPCKKLCSSCKRKLFSSSPKKILKQNTIPSLQLPSSIQCPPLSSFHCNENLNSMIDLIPQITNQSTIQSSQITFSPHQFIHANPNIQDFSQATIQTNSSIQTSSQTYSSMQTSVQTSTQTNLSTQISSQTIQSPINKSLVAGGTVILSQNNDRYTCIPITQLHSLFEANTLQVSSLPLTSTKQTPIIIKTPDIRFELMQFFGNDLKLIHSKINDEFRTNIINQFANFECQKFTITDYSPELRESLAYLATNNSISKVSEIMNEVYRPQHIMFQNCLSSHTIIKSKIELGIAAVLAILLYATKHDTTVKYIGFHFDDTSKDKFNKAYTCINLVAIDSNGATITIPLRLVELQLHNTGESLAKHLVQSIDEINEFLSLLQKLKWNLQNICWLTADNASVNMGQYSGAMTLFEKERKAQYLAIGNIEHEYQPCLFQGCQCHVVDLIAKKQEKVLTRVAIESGMSLQIMSKSHSDVHYIGNNLIQKLKNGFLHDLFLAYEHWTGSSHLSLLRVTDTRWLTLETAITHIVERLPIIIGFLMRFADLDKTLYSIYQLLCQSNVILAMIVTHIMNTKFFLPIMEIVDHSTQLDLIQSTFEATIVKCKNFVNESIINTIQYLKTTIFVPAENISSESLAYLQPFPMLHYSLEYTKTQKTIYHSNSMNLQSICMNIEPFKKRVQEKYSDTKMLEEPLSTNATLLKLISADISEITTLRESIIKKYELEAIQTAQRPQQIVWEWDNSLKKFAVCLVRECINSIATSIPLYQYNSNNMLYQQLNVLSSNRATESIFRWVDECLEKCPKMHCSLLLAHARIKISEPWSKSIFLLRHFENLKMNLPAIALKIMKEEPTHKELVLQKAEAKLLQLGNIYQQKKSKQQTKKPEEQLYTFLQKHYRDRIPQSIQKNNSNLYTMDLKKLCIAKQLGTYKDLKTKQDMISKLIDFFTTTEMDKWNQNHFVEQPIDEDEMMSDSDPQKQQTSSGIAGSTSYGFVEEE